MRRLQKIKNRWWVILTTVCVAVWSIMVLVQEDRFADSIEALLEQPEISWPSASLNFPQLRKYYTARRFQPVWIDEHGLLPHAKQLLVSLKGAASEGLDPNCYHVAAIEQYWPTAMPNLQIRLELLLTDAFMQYSRDVRSGRQPPGAKTPHWQVDTPKVNVAELLTEFLASRDFAEELKTLPPPHDGYQQLRQVLHRYQKMAREGGWSHVPNGPKLWQGIRHTQVPLLRQRLHVEGHLINTKALKNNLFDTDLTLAVKRYQTQHGLPVTGLVGPMTRAAMNVPIDKRIEQIKINMERWRWLPRKLGDDYLMVNTAGYELVVYEEEEPQLVMRVITGKPERPSPIVGGNVTRLVINPYWVVPTKIAVEDIIPHIQSDPNYLKEKNIRIFRGIGPDAKEVDPAQIDWRKIGMDYFPYTFRQEPGADNSLGRIKFIFLNDFDVYLHDTPIKQLFQQQTRAFSSGCIRVENPLQLAIYLLGEDSGWTREELEKAIGEGETESVSLPRTMPIYLVYWTSWVGIDQTVNFRNDVYKWDILPVSCG